MVSISGWLTCSSASKESVCNVENLGSIPRLGRSPGEGKGYQLQYSGLENSTDCIIHGVAKSRTRLRDLTFTFHFYALEKEMATHSSVLAWRIPGTGEPRGLPSMGSVQSGTRLKRLSSSRGSLKFLFCIGVWPINNVVIVSGEE